jgi:glycosyltransferase involved in cell wall biosynthesis
MDPFRLGLDAKRAFRNRTGLGNYSRALITALDQLASKRNVDLELHLFGPKPEPSILAEGFSIKDHWKLHHPSKTLHKALPSLYRSYGVKDDLKANHIHIYHGLSAELPIGIAKQGIRSVVTIHDLIFIHFPDYYKSFDRNTYTWKLEKALDQADGIIATSLQTANDLNSIYKYPLDKIDVIYQDCHPYFSQPPANADTIAGFKKNYGLPENYILMVGTIEKRKNQSRLVEAFAMVDKPDLHLVLVGRDGGTKSEVKKVIDRFNLHDRVHFPNNIPFASFPMLYDGALFVAYPSEFEGFGIPILEAFRRGKMVLTSKGSCFSEVGGDAAAYVNPYDALDIALGINTAIATSMERPDYVRERSLKQASLFSSDIMAENTWKVYDRIRGL